MACVCVCGGGGRRCSCFGRFRVNPREREAFRLCGCILEFYSPCNDMKLCAMCAVPPTSRCLCLALQVGLSYWRRLYIHLDPESCLPCPTRHIFYSGTPRHSKQFWYGCAVSESSKPRVAVCSFFKEPTCTGHQCGVV